MSDTGKGPVDGTPSFADVLETQWAWIQRPPLRTPGEIAEALGLNRATVWQWLRKGVRPSVGMVVLVSQRTGLPLNLLLRSAQYDALPPRDSLTTKQVYDDLVAAVERDESLSEVERQRFIDIVRERRSEYQTGQNAENMSEAL